MVLHYSFNSQSSTVKLNSTKLVLERLCLVLSWSQVPPAQLVLVPSTLRWPSLPLRGSQTRAAPLGEAEVYPAAKHEKMWKQLPILT